MKRNFFILVMCLVAAATIFSSCGGSSDDGKKKKATAKILSGPYEMLVVAHKSWLGSGDGIEFRGIVDHPIKGIPQAEPNFRVTTLEPRDYKGKYVMYGNILIADINDKYEKASLEVEYDVHAQPQIIATVKAPTSSRMMIFLENKKDSILDLFVQHEINREKSILDAKHSSVVLDAAKKMFGASIYAPVDVDQVFKKDNFFRAVSTKRFQIMNICMYSYPYTSKEDLNLDVFAQKRDSAMCKWVYGDTEENSMTTDTRCLYESTKTIDGKFVYVVRGLWYYNKAPFGGPFISYSYVDEEKGRVLVAEGFIWSPEEKKRALIRELEASMQTLRL